MEKTQVKAKRQSNFELLRIISMILIIAHHYAIHGGFELSKQAFSAQLFFLQVLSYGGKLGVNLFVLISGYFLVTSRCKLKKAVNLWMKVTVFSACIAIFSTRWELFLFQIKHYFNRFFLSFIIAIGLLQPILLFTFYQTISIS